MDYLPIVLPSGLLLLGLGFYFYKSSRVPEKKRKAESQVKKESQTYRGQRSSFDRNNCKDKDLRGYKLTSDGKLTTYFHREISEESKALLGDLAPKKIDSDDNFGKKTTSSGSAWNAAGTWEEKNVTAWVKERLKSSMGDVTFPIYDGLSYVGKVYDHILY